MKRPRSIINLTNGVEALAREPTHIRKLRFPNYKNLAPDSELPFDFPVTVLLGKNGTNKSSILHALYGCPSGRSIADFWFETRLDAIPLERDGRKQSVVHQYADKNGSLVECIKARAPRGEKDPDYWEAAKPTQVYGFPKGAKRHPPIDIPVHHLDFRGELPAFDKYFYFPDSTHLKRRERYAKSAGSLRRSYRKQDYLRRRSALVKSKIEGEGIQLDTSEIDIVCYVLQQNYLQGRLVRHSLFHGHEGWTIQFKTKTSSGYSDAVAGSGESAATLLIHNIVNARNGALILLDEPETSLHPAAQQRLLEFLITQAAQKSLQIVMATHSIYLATGLPQAAIRVLTIDGSGHVTVSTECTANEALHELGDIPPGKTILVEDKRAKHIVIEALKLESGHASSEFRVVERKGGTSRIYVDLQAHANSGRKDVFSILDGDHQPTPPIPKIDELPQGKNALIKLIRQVTKGNNEKGPSLDFVDAADCSKYLKYLSCSVGFLPKKTPEHLVWNDTTASKIIHAELPGAILDTTDHKEKIRLLAEMVPGLDEDSVFKTLLADFLRTDSKELDELKATINLVRNQAT